MVDVGDMSISELMAAAVAKCPANAAPITVAMSDPFGEVTTVRALLISSTEPEYLREPGEGTAKQRLASAFEDVRESDILFWMYHGREEDDPRDPRLYTGMEIVRRTCAEFLKESTGLMGSGKIEDARRLNREVAEALRTNLSPLSSFGGDVMDEYAAHLDEAAESDRPEDGYRWEGFLPDDE